MQTKQDHPNNKSDQKATNVDTHDFTNNLLEASLELGENNIEAEESKTPPETTNATNIPTEIAKITALGTRLDPKADKKTAQQAYQKQQNPKPESEKKDLGTADTSVTNGELTTKTVLHKGRKYKFISCQ